MSSDFHTRLHSIRQEAVTKKNERKRAWSAARKVMGAIFQETEYVLQDGYSGGESNGDTSYLKHGNDKLEFRMDGSRNKVIRTSTRETGEMEYDIEKLDEESIEAEIEEFVRSIYS